MMDSTLGSLTLLLKADASNMNNVVGAVRKGLMGFTRDLAGLAGVGLSVGGVIAGLKESLSLGGSLYDLSQQTGVAVDQLVVLRQALDETGVGAGRAMFILNMMQRNVNTLGKTGKGNSFLSSIGLSMKELNKQSPVEKLKTISTALGKLSEEDRMSALRKLFGHGGIRLRGFFADPNVLKEVEHALGGIPALIMRNAKSFDQLLDVISRFKYIRLGLFTGIMEGLAPMMKTITDEISKIDLSGIGQRIGRFVLFIVELIKSGRFGELMKLEFEYAFSWIADNWMSLVQHLGTVLKVGFKIALSEIYNMLSGTKIGNFLGLSGKIDMAAQMKNGMAAIRASAAEIGKNSSEQTLVLDFKKQFLIDDIMAVVEDRIAKQQNWTPMTTGGTGGAGETGAAGFVNKYAPTALRGSVEGYKAEMGMSKDMANVATNTAKTAQNTNQTADKLDEMNDTLNENLNFAVLGEGGI